ncbi:hypothetical protein D1641_08125 [Colidextribacter sp. OB.20]|uniref:hypothetical protein n=1 Tax=Colidextribacter sp. OB.20 TaxID=2304568 RepID=UPI0013688B67|nr:hypothetical protein [Colidextribacter sp. OB.20]NBI09985.1 hypothetical protein [Colidextribacter sp. OB.20]
MQLYEEILMHYLTSQECVISVDFPGLEHGVKEIVELASYQALSKIQKILMDDSLTDQECYNKIEEIVHVFENLGSDCGN